jgi:hypothetical protein
MTKKQKEIVTQLLRQAGYKEEALSWVNYTVKSMIPKEELFGDESPDSKGNASAEEQEDRDNFAIAFAVWAIHDPQAIAYRQARISAGDLLRKYKDRPYINTDLSTQ